jgi:hypothetical protein
VDLYLVPRHKFRWKQTCLCSASRRERITSRDSVTGVSKAVIEVFMLFVCLFPPPFYASPSYFSFVMKNSGIVFFFFFEIKTNGTEAP